jgi:predicted lipoprotein with Yx(FWY)xxD motif
MTLYYMASDPAKIERETCDAQCRKENLEAVVAPAGTQPIGNWSTLKLDDGAMQWSYMGLGVYRFKHDKLPGDILGDKFATGAAIRDGWRAILKESLIQKLF